MNWSGRTSSSGVICEGSAALYRSAAFLGTHLDAISEMQVRHALAELMRDRTTIVIAHRLSTVRDADLIAVLDAGHLVESGTHSALIAHGGLYAELVGHQLALGRAAE